MGKDLDKDTLYVGLNDTSLVVKYFSEVEGRWMKNSRSFMCAGRSCAERTVSDLSQLVASANGNISSFGSIEGLESQKFFSDAIGRSYKFYTDNKGSKKSTESLLG